MDERAKWVTFATAHRILEPDSKPDEPAVPRIGDSQAGVCETDGTLEKWLVRRVTAHHAIKP